MIAIDIALIPPDHILEEVQRLNRQIAAAKDVKISFEDFRCWPHITLVMGVLPKRDLGKVQNIIADCAAENAPLVLRTTRRPGEATCLHLERSHAIAALHADLMTRLKSIIGHPPQDDTLYLDDAEEMKPQTLDYICRFSERSSFEHYAPHITVDSGATDMRWPELEFTVERLALCHLGNHCTCRKILAEWRLAQKDKLH